MVDFPNVSARCNTRRQGTDQLQTGYAGSIPAVASINKINDLVSFLTRSAGPHFGSGTHWGPKSGAGMGLRNLDFVKELVAARRFEIAFLEKN